MPAARIATDGTAPAQWGKVQANRARLTDRVIALLEEAKRDGTPLRWQRPWQEAPGATTPVNAITGAPYRGGNALHLFLVALERGYARAQWCTALQASQRWSYLADITPGVRQSLGVLLARSDRSAAERRTAVIGALYPGRSIVRGAEEEAWAGEFIAAYDRAGMVPTQRRIRAHVRRGEHGVPCEYWHPLTPAEQAERERKGLKPLRLIAFSFTAFNLAQIEGVPQPPVRTRTWDPCERAEGVLAASGARISHGADAAFYSPQLDQIRLPAAASFADAPAYYTVALHELTHWSGHPKRMNRVLSTDPSSVEYAREELCAELGSLFLASEVDLEPRTRNCSAYLDSWLDLLRAPDGGANEIYRAAAHAQAACDFLLALERQLERPQREPSTAVALAVPSPLVAVAGA